jgi:hypothetical protein
LENSTLPVGTPVPTMSMSVAVKVTASPPVVGDQHFTGRGHFFAAAAEAMRRMLVEDAHRKAGRTHVSENWIP